MYHCPKISNLLYRDDTGKWYRGYDNKMASFPYGQEAPIYAGLAYNIFARDFLEWFFSDDKTQENIFKYLIN